MCPERRAKKERSKQRDQGFVQIEKQTILHFTSEKGFRVTLERFKTIC